MSSLAEKRNNLLSPNRPKARVLDFKPMRKGTLRGFCAIELPIGSQIFDLVIGESNGHAWAMFPSKPILDAEERQMVDAAGKKQYAPFLACADPKLWKAFSGTIVALVRSAHPDTFGSET